MVDDIVFVNLYFLLHKALKKKNKMMLTQHTTNLLIT